jgi:CopG family nickel-responsive transcriptional regulator
MDAGLVDRLDDLVAREGRRNRSQALAELVRAHLVERSATTGRQEIAGTITLVYDHHRGGIQAALTGIQHHAPGRILSTLHVHLDEDNCLEVLAVRGRADVVRQVADRLIATRGVKHGRLTVTTTGREFRA